MICILHSRSLSRSSDLWAHSVLQALARRGEDVHVVCGDTHPERYDFVAQAYGYEVDGIETLLHRGTPYPGRVVVHRPRFPDDFERVLLEVVRGWGIDSIVAIGAEMRAVGEPVAHQTGAVCVERNGSPNHGVDTSLCQPVRRSRRRESISRLHEVLLNEPRHSGRFLTQLANVSWETDRIVLYAGSHAPKTQRLGSIAQAVLEIAPDIRIIVLGAASLEGCDDERVLFAGTLDLPTRRLLVPCADVALFPVPDPSSPRWMIESLAAGVMPIGAYEGSIRQTIDELSLRMPNEVVRIMKLGSDPAAGVSEALGVVDTHRRLLRRIAVEDYDWRNVAKTLLASFEAAQPDQPTLVAADDPSTSVSPRRP